MNSTIQKWGNSQAIRLPKALLETASIKENEQVRIFAEQNRIIIEKVKISRRHKTLAERLDGFDGDHVGEEWDTGSPIGREI